MIDSLTCSQGVAASYWACTSWSGVILTSSVVNNQLKLNLVIIEFKGSGGMAGLKEFELNPNKQELTCHVIWSYSKHTQMSWWPKPGHDEWNYHFCSLFRNKLLPGVILLFSSPGKFLLRPNSSRKPNIRGAWLLKSKFDSILCFTVFWLKFCPKIIFN